MLTHSHFRERTSRQPPRRSAAKVLGARTGAGRRSGRRSSALTAKLAASIAIPPAGPDRHNERAADDRPKMLEKLRERNSSEFACWR
jgi:hypothetical protein